MTEDKTIFAEIPRTCTLYNLRRAARAVTDLYDAILAPSGVHGTQLTLLVAVKAYGPVSMSGLATGVSMDRTTLTRTLKPLQDSGWLAIEPGKDRRVQEVRLTAAGDDILTQAVPLWEQAQKQVRTQLGEEPWRQLLTQLQYVSSLEPMEKNTTQ